MNHQIVTTFGEGNIQALNICKDLSTLVPPQDEELVFDMRRYGENNPFSNLVLVNSLRRFKDNHKDSQLFCKPKEPNGYLSHIGFYKASGIRFGNSPGEARASSNYVPITAIQLNDSDFYDSIELRAQELAATLGFDPALQQMLQYIFIETIRNVFEHANTDMVWVAAQKWPTYNLVEIAIADSGEGIYGSLGKVFAINESEILRLACKPGITARSNHNYLDAEDSWRNSGYGLYMMKELAIAYQGSLLLCSGKYAVRYSSEGEEIFQTNYMGTAIGIRFYIDKAEDFNKVRDRILLTGEKEAKEIKGAIKKASRSSGGRYHF